MDGEASTGSGSGPAHTHEDGQRAWDRRRADLDDIAGVDAVLAEIDARAKELEQALPSRYRGLLPVRGRSHSATIHALCSAVNACRVGRGAGSTGAD